MTIAIQLPARLMHWDNLRTLLASRLVQSTVIVPVIGYIILFNAELQEYLRLTIDPGVTLNSWRLYFLYFGFSSLAVSAVIYNVRCPPEVRHHGSAYAFVASEQAIVSHERLEGMAKALRVYSRDSPGGRVFVMRDYFELLEEIRPKSRKAVFAFYAAGVGLVAIPTVVTFLFVLWSAASALIGR